MEKSRIQLRRSFRRQLFRSSASLLLVACSSGDGGLASRRSAAPNGDEPITGLVEDPLDPAFGTPGVLAPPDAHAVFGIEPGHGPFRGGQVALIRGNGFSSQVRVWFGDVEVPAAQLTATRADRVQVTVPAGTPGNVAITTQNADDASTRRVLDAAYLYDSFYADPAEAPTSGGSVITLRGQGTAWNESSSVSIDQQVCEVVEVRGEAGGAQELDCRAPAGTEGEKTISIATGTGVDTVIGGFNYAPGAAVLGGLGGAAIAGRLAVHVTAAGGTPVADAYVILGSDLDIATLGQPGSNVQQTDASGDVVFEQAFDSPPLVTIAARCFHPRSFVGVPVDTVRAELDPVASPDCGESQPGFFGGAPTQPVFLRGELVWPGEVEFQRAGWTNVPLEREGERRAAYVFQPSGDPEQGFRLPRETDAITPDANGQRGYEFQLITGGGSRTLYAIAGIENRSESPPRFTAYAMGLLRGVYANSGETVEGLAIRMDRTLDQALRFDVVGPAPGAKGPDRLSLRAAVQVAGEGYAILPNTELETAVAGGNGLAIIGVPPLVGDLEGSRYVVGARAYTGAGSAPMSVLPLITAAESSTLIPVNGFLPVPTLRVGAEGAVAWNGELGVTFDDPGSAVSVARYDVRSGNGLISWSIAAPPSATAFRLPDLSRLPEGGLLAGVLDVSVSLASVPDFDYATVTSTQLSRFSWEAYATDVGSTRYQPAP